MRATCFRPSVYPALLSFAVIVACGRSPSATVTDDLPESRRVVAISLRGASYDALLRRAEELDDSTLGRLVNGGVRAGLRPLPNAETFPAMATFESGAWPAQHGVVGNTYHVTGDPISHPTRAYSDAVFSSETLWEAAQRQGKKVIRIGTLFPDAARSSGTAAAGSGSVHSLPQAEQLGYGRVTDLAPTPGGSPWRLGSSGDGARGSGGDVGASVPLVHGADAPPLAIEGEADDPFVLQLHALAVAPPVDSAESAPEARPFDRVVLDDDRDLGNGVRAELGPGDWAPVIMDQGSTHRSPTIGAWVKLLDLDGESGAARLYLRPIYRNRGTPSEFIAALEEALGFAPGAPDYQSLSRGLIDADTVLEEIEREVAYVIDAAVYAIDHLDFDLLLIDNPALDRIGHPFHVVDPRQQAWQDGAVAIAEDRWRWGYRLADAGLDAILSRLGSISDNRRPPVLVVTSEYGFSPAHTRIAINRLLADAGFAVRGEDLDEVRAFASTTSAHIRVNPDVVAATEVEDTVERLSAALQGWLHPETGEEVFDLVVPRSDLGRYHLDHPSHSGDLWVRLRPGYTFHGSTDPERPLFDTPRFAGDHGYAPREPGANGFLLVHGLDGSTISTDEVEAVDVAVTVAGLLDLEPPRGSQGQDVLN